jgi:hypothetical protein
LKLKGKFKSPKKASGTATFDFGSGCEENVPIKFVAELGG